MERGPHGHEIVDGADVFGRAGFHPESRPQQCHPIVLLMEGGGSSESRGAMVAVDRIRPIVSCVHTDGLSAGCPSGACR